MSNKPTIALHIKEYRDEITRLKAELTRLLAIEAAAKILAGPSNVRYCPESQGMADYQCLTCHSSWVKKATQYTLLPAPY